MVNKQQLKNGWIASCSRDETIKIWNKHERCIETLYGHCGDVLDIVQLQDSKIASSSSDHSIGIWDILDGNLLHEMEGSGPDMIIGIIQLQNGSILSFSETGIIDIWCPITGIRLTTMCAGIGYIWNIIQLRDSRIVATSSKGIIKIWR